MKRTTRNQCPYEAENLSRWPDVSFGWDDWDVSLDWDELAADMADWPGSLLTAADLGDWAAELGETW